MTVAEFRRRALRLPGTVEGAHMDHADFRVGGKIFATLGYPDDEHAVVLLPADEQQRYVETAASAFAAVKGAWGKNGATQMRLAEVETATADAALLIAWRKRAPKKLLAQV